MPKMIQLRNVPDKLHRTLKSRAAMEGLSLLSIYSHIFGIAKLPTPAECASVFVVGRLWRPLFPLLRSFERNVIDGDCTGCFCSWLSNC